MSDTESDHHESFMPGQKLNLVALACILYVYKKAFKVLKELAKND